MSDGERGARPSGPMGAFGGMKLTGIDPGVMGTAYSQAMLDLQRDWLVGMSKLQRDYLGFLGERMRKDVEVAKRMAECRDVKAALELQTAFVDTAREDYLEEAQKLLAMSREMAETCVQRLGEVSTRKTGEDDSA